MDTPFEQINEFILDIFANAVLTEIKKRLEIANIENRFIANFIYDLIYKKISDDEAERRAKVLGFSMDSGYALIAVNPSGRGKLLKSDVQGYISSYENLNEQILSSIASFCKRVFPKDVAVKFGETLYILHRTNGCGGEAAGQVKTMCAELLATLKKQFDGMHFKTGIGETVRGLFNIGTSFHQAWAAINYGELVYSDCEDYILAYSDNSMLKLFGRLKETGSLKEIIPESLLELYKRDKKNNYQMYDTLKAYLNANCNARKAAERLFIHYKTMLYRLEKLKKDYNIDLENSGSRLYIELGIQLIDIENRI